MYVFGGKAKGDEGMLHNTLIAAHFGGVMGLEEEEDAAEDGEDEGPGDDEEDDTEVYEKKATRGTFLPGSQRFSPAAAKKYKAN